MGNNIRYSKEALRDLDDIWDHIAQELQNPSAAKRVVDRIMDAVDQLKTFPSGALPWPLSRLKAVITVSWSVGAT